MSDNEDKLFDDAFNAVVGDGDVTVDESVDDVSTDDDKNIDKEKSGEDTGSKKEEVSTDSASEDDDKKPEITEVDRLQQTILRQAAAQSALQKKLNEKDSEAIVVRKSFEPVIGKDGVFTESFKEIQKEFPEADFGRVETIIGTQEQQLLAQQEELKQLRDAVAATNNNMMVTQRQQAIKDSMAIVRQSHPDVDEFVLSDEFKQWQKGLTPAELHHVGNTVKSDEIANIINVAKSVTGFKSKAALEAESKKVADDTVKKREKRDIAAQGIPVKQQATPVTGVTEKLNEDAIFDKVFKDLGIS